jgi:hypothetical protein
MILRHNGSRSTPGQRPEAVEDEVAAPVELATSA